MTVSLSLGYNLLGECYNLTLRPLAHMCSRIPWPWWCGCSYAPAIKQMIPIPIWETTNKSNLLTVCLMQSGPEFTLNDFWLELVGGAKKLHTVFSWITRSHFATLKSMHWSVLFIITLLFCDATIFSRWDMPFSTRFNFSSCYIPWDGLIKYSLHSKI
jgi:hypothetical protein